MANQYRAQKHKTDSKTISDINVVPYIDVMLVLLVIFMATAPLMYQQINIQLPQTTSAKEADLKSQYVVIDLLKNNQFKINYSGEKTDVLDSLPIDAIIKHTDNNQLNQIFIRSDKNIEYGKVISTMEILKDNDLNNIGLITEKE